MTVRSVIQKRFVIKKQQQQQHQQEGLNVLQNMSEVDIENLKCAKEVS